MYCVRYRRMLCRNISFIFAIRDIVFDLGANGFLRLVL